MIRTLMKAAACVGVAALLCIQTNIWSASSAAAQDAKITSKFSRAPVVSLGRSVDHGVWSRILRIYVKAGRDGINRVEYARLKAKRIPRVKAYIAALEKVDPARLTRAQQMAFWINLYNAKTLDIVLGKYPVKSIKDINLPDGDGKMAEGPWKAKLITVSGVKLSLDDIENSILRPVFKDPRVHYALNCLSIGCPNLLREAYTGTRLERQLERASRDFVNNPRAISFEGGKVKASSIYDWFAADYGGFKGVVSHLTRYAAPELKKKLTGLTKIDVYDYDWRLSDVKTK